MTDRSEHRLWIGIVSFGYKHLFFMRLLWRPTIAPMKFVFTKAVLLFFFLSSLIHNWNRANSLFETPEPSLDTDLQTRSAGFPSAPSVTLNRKQWKDADEITTFEDDDLCVPPVLNSSEAVCHAACAESGGPSRGRQAYEELYVYEIQNRRTHEEVREHREEESEPTEEPDRDRREN